MAVVRNITNDALEVAVGRFSRAVDPDAELDIPNEDFADRAWPKSTWAVAKKPGKGYRDASVDDAHVFVSAPAEDTTADEENV